MQYLATAMTTTMITAVITTRATTDASSGSIKGAAVDMGSTPFKHVTVLSLQLTV